MAGPHDSPAALKELQDSIYREKVLRARAMTPVERFESGFDLTRDVFHRMLAGAMSRLQTDNEEAGWREVDRWMSRLRKARDHGYYSEG